MKQPNIILINCDDLGYGDLGCYGSKKNKTPHIDQLAKEGTLLEEFYVASPVCSASRASLMTGCYPCRVGIPGVLFPGYDFGLSSSETTIAELLKGKGYNTKIIGKWHLGDQAEFLPTEHGFDEYYGLPYSNDMGCQSDRTDKETFPPLPLIKDKKIIQEQPDQRGLTERYLEQAVEFIQRDRQEPFFLYFAHMYVHVPLFVPQRFMEQSDNGAYGGAVECIDWTLGVIRHELKKLGLEDDTIIIFTSDNGSRARDEGGSNAPLKGTKATTWEGGQRVPFIVKYPSRVPENQRINGCATSMDLLPTLSTWAQVTQKPQNLIDGLDLSSWVEGRAPESPRQTFYYYNHWTLEAIRHGDWKLHFNKVEELTNELYHLKEDPSESNNLYDAQPEIVAELTAMAKKVRSSLGDERLGIPGPDLREPGRVSQAKNLTVYHPEHPYMVAEYDLADSKVMAG